MRLSETFLFPISGEIYSNSSTIIKPFKDEALIVPNFRQMLFLVSCSTARRKIEIVVSQCLPLTFLPARNTWCLETDLWVSVRLNPQLSEKNATFLFENNSDQSHGLLRQYLYGENWGWMLVTLSRGNWSQKCTKIWQWRNVLAHKAGCKCIFCLLYRKCKY